MRRVIAVLTLALCVSGAARAESSDLPPVVQLEMELQREGIGTGTLTLMAVALWRGNLGNRWRAIEILGLRKATSARFVLRWIMDTDRELLIKETAALALARLGDDTGTVALEKLMFTAAAEDRRVFLATRLAEFRNPVGYSFGLSARRAQQPATRLLVVDALVAFVALEGRTPRLAPDPSVEFMAFLKDPYPWVRMTTLTYLPSVLQNGSFPIAQARLAVERLATTEPDPQVKEFARVLIGVWDEWTAPLTHHLRCSATRSSAAPATRELTPG